MMHEFFQNRRFLGAVLTVALVLGFSGIATAATCLVSGSLDCSASVTIVVYTGGDPVPVCLKGYDVYEVTISGSCLSTGSFGPHTELVCGALDTPIVYSEDGKTHTFQPRGSHTWEDVFNDCRKLAHSVS